MEMVLRETFQDLDTMPTMEVDHAMPHKKEGPEDLSKGA
jgi:hypothetical protein